MTAAPIGHGSSTPMEGATVNQEKPQKRFQFIDNSHVALRGSSSTQVRRHVMQEYMREKRWASRARSEQDSTLHLRDQSTNTNPRSSQRRESQAQSIPMAMHQKHPSRESWGDSAASSISTAVKVEDPRPKESSLRPEREDIHDVCNRIIQSQWRVFNGAPCGTRLSSGLIASQLSGRNGNEEDSLTRLARRPLPEPASILSAARTDPFDVLPLPLNIKEQEFFDFYAQVMPRHSYGFEKRNPFARKWYWSVMIPEAMRGPSCFQSIVLAHAAQARAKLTGQIESKLVAHHHRDRATQLFERHVRGDPHGTLNETISATISAAIIVEANQSSDGRRPSWGFWRTIMQKIEQRDGGDFMTQGGTTQILLYWSDYTNPGYNSTISIFDPAYRNILSGGDNLAAIGVVEEVVSYQCSELVAFLKCVEWRASTQLGRRGKTSRGRAVPLHVSTFEPGGALFSLASGSNSLRYGKSGQFKQSICRLASLMIIHVAMWQYRDEPDVMQGFFVDLIQNVREYGLDKRMSSEALVQILLCHSQAPVFWGPERLWVVGRMVKIVQRLSKSTFDKLNDMLLKCLRMGPDLACGIDDWEQELRDEILQAPLISDQPRFMTE